MENLRVADSVRLLIHPGCVLDSGVNHSQLVECVKVYRKLLHEAAKMSEYELMIGLPCASLNSFHAKQSELLSQYPDNEPFQRVLAMKDSELDPDDYVDDHLTHSQALNPVFLFRALADILGDRLILALLSRSEYEVPADVDINDVIFSKAESQWVNHGFCLSPETRVLAYGEYMIFCVRSVATAFVQKYSLTPAVVVSAMTDLPIDAVMAGGEQAALLQDLTYLAGSDPDDQALLAQIQKDLEYVTYVPPWINAAIMDFQKK